jgi:aldehyde dehydrogenase (NAD+)
MSTVLDLNQDDMYCAGSWVRAVSEERVALINPANEEVYGSAPVGNSADVDTAVTAARTAFERSGWSALSPSERGGYLLKMADVLDRRATEVGAFVTTENGTLLSQSIAVNGHVSAMLLRFYANLSETVVVEEDRGSSLVRREPVGVAGMIVPWNGPQILAVQKLAPAMVMGCAMVIKPAAETSLDIRFLVEAAEEAGVPAGIINVVTGGRETGAALVAHPSVDHISFTGSATGGRSVAAACGRGLKSVTLELGGKSAALILDDADVEEFCRQMPALCLANSGQGCFLSTRIVVQRSRFDEVCEGLTATLATMPAGDPLDPETAFGPIVNAAQHQRVLEYVQSGTSQGARAILGGRGRPAQLDRGYFVEPTVFVDVTREMRIFREEIFGPVLVVVAADDDDDAIAIANDSDYGLGGMVWTGDLERGNAVARRIQSGTIGVNGYTLDPQAPFGGVKGSGLGRELGPEGLAAYFNYKSIYQSAGAFF